ncbi:class I SAM-dependent methyltransferase [Effusibacillus consociatus]|uniref:class I SAM-dependent methyltransferase n=1 Tax=Effusibacillus consociatus TaxID=1117041 RepID=UPI0036D42275
MALYYPGLGYYERGDNPFGKTGDFYTAPGVHPVFGHTLARDFYAKWKELGCVSPFILVEFGAGQGTLAKDILNGIRLFAPDLFSVLEYRIFEKSSYLRGVQREVLADQPVTWCSASEHMGQFPGIILSNEVIDAAPVHLIVQDSEPQEVYVGEQNGQFVERLGPLSNERIHRYLREYVSPLTPGQRVEVNLHALEWLVEATEFLQNGYIVTIDYGDETEILYEGRLNGTLRGFRQHQLQTNVLASPGELDITCDVNFTALLKYGESLGMETAFFGTQGKFLTQAGIFEFLSNESAFDPFSEGVKRNMAIKHLIMPGGMGERFKVLVQRKYG